MNLFDTYFSVPAEITNAKEFLKDELGWAEFQLNPRWLRGSDFLMRWLQDSWTEKTINYAVNASQDYFAIPYAIFSSKFA